MQFNETLNKLLNELSCTPKELSHKSGISQSVISRYRSGTRTPSIESKQLKKIIDTLYNISIEKQKNNYTREYIKEVLTNSINNKDNFNYKDFSNKFNQLIKVLNINISEMAKNIAFDASHISRIRNGKTRPSDPLNFSLKICNYITSKYNTNEDKKKLSTIIEKDYNKINNKTIYNWLIKSNEISPNEVNNFLNSVDNFNINNYIKSIKFDEIKVPSIPFYKLRNKNYYGLEEMKKAEIDFLKATTFFKGKEDVFMCSDMPMEDMAVDTDFAKKWMFGIAILLKKGLHLNIIHNINRPFNEMMLGLESWIPIYMTGQVSPYYLKDIKNNPYMHLNYVSSQVALTGECLKGYHNKGKYYITSNSKELLYYKEKRDILLKKATPLMEIFTEENKSMYKEFITKDTKIITNRKRTISSLPLFTIDDTLLLQILKRNKLSIEDIEIIMTSKKREKEIIENILTHSKIEDHICIQKQKDEIYLSLESTFYNKKIKYTYEEYKKHLKNTKEYYNKNYKIIYEKNSTFKNITITIVKDNYVVISKIESPNIHFIIKHPKLVDAITNFDPPLVEV